MNQMTELAHVPTAGPLVEVHLDVPQHPVTILVDRRAGQMTWVAIPFDPDHIDYPEWDEPQEVADFWNDLAADPIGRGATPHLALMALQEALQRVGGYEVYATPPKHRMTTAWGR